MTYPARVGLVVIGGKRGSMNLILVTVKAWFDRIDPAVTEALKDAFFAAVVFAVVAHFTLWAVDTFHLLAR
jgi:hypothetical protein